MSAEMMPRKNKRLLLLHRLTAGGSADSDGLSRQTDSQPVEACAALMDSYSGAVSDLRALAVP